MRDDLGGIPSVCSRTSLRTSVRLIERESASAIRMGVCLASKLQAGLCCVGKPGGHRAHVAGVVDADRLRGQRAAAAPRARGKRRVSRRRVLLQPRHPPPRARKGRGRRPLRHPLKQFTLWEPSQPFDLSIHPEPSGESSHPRLIVSCSADDQLPPREKGQGVETEEDAFERLEPPRIHWPWEDRS